MFSKNRNLGYGKADKTTLALNRIRNKQRINEAKMKMRNAKRQASTAKMKERLNSSNPIVRKLAQHRQESIKRQEVKIRKLESDAKVAELDPKLQAENAKAENKIKIEKARARSKTASSTAIATGMATLGRGLSDENNQDDEARRQSDQKIIETIFRPNPETTNDTSGNTGLSQGVE